MYHSKGAVVGGRRTIICSINSILTHHVTRVRGTQACTPNTPISQASLVPRSQWTCFETTSGESSTRLEGTKPRLANMINGSVFIPRVIIDISRPNIHYSYRRRNRKLGGSTPQLLLRMCRATLGSWPLSLLGLRSYNRMEVKIRKFQLKLIMPKARPHLPKS